MNRLKMLFVMGLILATMGLFWAVGEKTGYCFMQCQPRQCWNDMRCGLGCWCYKGQYDFKGVCVKKL